MNHSAAIAQASARALENAPVFAALLAPDGQIVAVNRMARNVLGLAENASLDGHSLFPLLTAEATRTLYGSALPTVMRAGSWHGELAVRSTAGGTTPLRVSLAAARGEDGTVDSYAFFGVVPMASDSPEASESASDLRLKRFVENATEPVFVLERGVVVAANAFACTAWGSTLATLRGQPLGSLVSRRPERAAEASAFGEAEKQLSVTGGRHVAEHVVETADGRTFRARFQMTAILGGLGHAFTIVEARDVSVEHDEAERLRDNERLLRTLVDYVPGVVYRCRLDAAWTMLFLNDAIESLVGYPASDFIDNRVRTYASTIHPDDVGMVEQAVVDAVMAGTPFGIEYRLVHRSGRVQWVHERGRALPSTDTGPGDLIGTIVDISDRRATLADLERARRDAEAANIAKSRFLAMMSHEIRTPMNAILNMASLAIDAGLNERAQRFVEILLSSSRGLLSLLDDILDFSKIEADRLELEQAEFDLHALLDELVDTFRGHAERAGGELEFVFTIDPAVPARVFGDALRLRQVLSNLLSNAFKFTSRGEVVLEAECHTADAGDSSAEFRFAVRDTGIGIPEDARHRIFDSFAQADGSTTRRFGGSGLGLAISRRIVQRMGSDIEVQSEEGIGSSFAFSVRLPVSSTQPAPRFDLGGGPELRALIVDDSQTARRSLERSLRALGIGSSAVGTAAEAVDLLEGASGAWGIMFVDATLPDNDGAEFVSRLREFESPGIPPAVLMGSGMANVDTRALRARGLSAVIHKPATRTTVANAIAAALDPGRVSLRTSGSHPVATLPDLTGRRILIVEDNPTNRIVAHELLGPLGGELVTVTNGLEAVEMMKARRFDLVLMDTQMPVLDGLEATRRIRRLPQGSDVPIVALTANVLPAEMAACREAGMDDTVSKPIDRRVLYAVIRRVIRPGPRRTVTATGLHATVPAALEVEPQSRPEWLDVDEAAARLGLQPDRIVQIARGFADREFGLWDRLQSAYSLDPGEAVSLAHALSGAAGNVGAIKLRDAMRALERGIREGGDTRSVWANAQSAALQVFGSSRPSHSSRTPTNLAPISALLLTRSQRSASHALVVALDGYDRTGALALINLLRVDATGELAVLLDALDRDVADHNFDRAATRLRAMVPELRETP
jgi:PAS domain S-box-containing protein